MPSFKLEEYEKLDKWLDRTTKDGVRRGLLSAGWRLIGVIQNEIIPAERPPPINEGKYRASWAVRPTDGGAEVYNDSDHAPFIERGVRGANVKIGRKMIDALAEWARLKGLTGHPLRQRSSIDARLEARRIAWAVAKSMQKKGIFNRDGSQGLQIAKKAKERLVGFVEEEIRREMRRR